ncbi:MAG: pyridoxamine 5'-phosphate oxidase family protein [Acidimicrobiia bacterium]
MTTDFDVTARDFLAAATSESATAEQALRSALHDDVHLLSPVGEPTGPDAVLETIGMFRGLFATGTWSEPRAGEGEVVFTATFPPGGPLGSAEVTLRFDDDGRIVEIRERLTPGGPPPAVPVDLDQLATEINGALGDGNTVVVAYVDGDGQPQLSFRGTVQVLDAARLALWIRDPNGGLPKALAGNPRLSFWYHDRSTRTTYQVQGRGRVDPDPQARTTVYDNSPEREQQFDPDRAGVAVVVDVDLVTGRGPAGAVNMRLDAQP